MSHPFELSSLFSPAGDQPQAIAALIAGLTQGETCQTLLGVTGSGKTFTVANVIQQLQRTTLVLAPNKTLAAQLYSEFRDFFPTPWSISCRTTITTNPRPMSLRLILI